MRIHQILEARRNPEVNKKTSALSELQKYAGNKDVFVSFTHDVGRLTHSKYLKSKNTSGAKLGINPKTDHDTPIGIYGYPIDYVLKKNTKVEYGSDRPFIWVFRVKNINKALILSNYTKEDLEKDLGKLRVLYKNEVSKSKDDAIINRVIDGIFNSGKNGAFRGTPEGIIWNTTRLLSSLHKARNYVEWSLLFRKLGYESVIDYEGYGVIHKNEPIQAVFFGKDTIETIELIRNINPKDPNSYSKVKILSQNRELFFKAIKNKSVSDADVIDILENYNTEWTGDAYPFLSSYVQHFIRKYPENFVGSILLKNTLGFSDSEILRVIVKKPSLIVNLDESDMTDGVINYILYDLKQNKYKSPFASIIEFLKVSEKILENMYSLVPKAVNYRNDNLSTVGIKTIFKNIDLYDKETVGHYLKTTIWNNAYNYEPEIFVEYANIFVDEMNIDYYVRSLWLIGEKKTHILPAYVELFPRTSEEQQRFEMRRHARQNRKMFDILNQKYFSGEYHDVVNYG